MEIQLKNEKTISSLDLVKEINVFRQKEFEYKKENGLKLGKVEEKNNKATELRHDTLINIIRDEFEEEIQLQNILELQRTIETSNGGTKEVPYFELNLEQAKQIYSRESKFVRRRMIEYIKKLDNVNYNTKVEIEFTLKDKKISKVETKVEANNFLKVETSSELKYGNAKVESLKYNEGAISDQESTIKNITTKATMQLLSLPLAKKLMRNVQSGLGQ